MKLYFCHLRLCAKFQNPRTTPSVRKVCETGKIRGSFLPSLYMLAPSLSGKVKCHNPTNNQHNMKQLCCGGIIIG